MRAVCVVGRKNIYDILTQHDAYSVLPPSQKLFVFNTNNPLDLVFQSLRRQGTCLLPLFHRAEAVEGIIWDSKTGTYEGVITSSDLLFCLNKQVSSGHSCSSRSTPYTQTLRRGHQILSIPVRFRVCSTMTSVSIEVHPSSPLHP